MKMTDYEQMMLKLKLVELGQNQTMLSIVTIIADKPNATAAVEIAGELLELAAIKANKLLDKHKAVLEVIAKHA